MIGRSEWGTTHGGVRWKTCSCSTSGWIVGTIWIADAPVPSTATFLPARSTEWSHCAEWKEGPAKRVAPRDVGQPRLAEAALAADERRAR